MSAIGEFRDKLKKGQVCTGAAITFCDPLVSEVLGHSADFLWYDLEHSPISAESLNAHMMAARGCQVPSIVRVPANQTGFIKPALDSGATAIVVPVIRSAEEVKSIVSDCRYPPLGTRGFGPRVPSNFGREPASVVVERENRDVFVSVMIETAEALENIDAIVQVEGLDSVVIGPSDLSFALGVGGDLEHPKVVQAQEIIIARAKAAGLFVGAGLGADAEYGRILTQRGIQWLQAGSDFSYLINTFDGIKAGIDG